MADNHDVTASRDTLGGQPTADTPPRPPDPAGWEVDLRRYLFDVEYNASVRLLGYLCWRLFPKVLRDL